MHTRLNLNQDCGILKTDPGTERIRDLVWYGEKIVALATQGYDTSSGDSEDLIAFKDERLLKVNASGDNLKMSEKQEWIPEVFYDRIIDRQPGQISALYLLCLCLFIIQRHRHQQKLKCTL